VICFDLHAIVIAQNCG